MNRIDADLIFFDKPVPYSDGLKLQHSLVGKRKADEIRDTLILLEHEPVITLGKNADTAGIVATDSLLEQRGISVHRVERGGQATYHGPGQITGYPILKLREFGLGVSAYVAKLEDVMIGAAGLMGVDACRRSNVTGVFASREPRAKIGAIGVRITMGVTFHGFAFNVCPELRNYDLIVPCGAAEIPVSSLVRELESQEVEGRSPDTSGLMKAAIDAIVSSFENEFQTRFLRN